MSAGVTDGNATVRCRFGDACYRGEVVRVDCDVDPNRVAAAVRRAETTPDDWVAVEAPSPTAVHEHVGCLAPTMGLKTRTALARAGRSRGLSTPHDDQLASARESLAEMEVSHQSTERRRDDHTRACLETEQLREEVATLRGRLQAERDDGGESEATLERLRARIRELSEAETERTATRQQLRRERRAAREYRDRRDRVRRLEDRVANLERRARADLVEQLREEYVETLGTVPGERTDRRAAPFEAEPVTAALAIARLAALSAPVVLACDRFESPATAAEWLDAAIIQV